MKVEGVIVSRGDPSMLLEGTRGAHYRAMLSWKVATKS